jgi:hypothetical protein
MRAIAARRLNAYKASFQLKLPVQGIEHGCRNCGVDRLL